MSRGWVEVEFRRTQRDRSGWSGLATGRRHADRLATNYRIEVGDASGGGPSLRPLRIVVYERLVRLPSSTGVESTARVDEAEIEAVRALREGGRRLRSGWPS